MPRSLAIHDVKHLPWRWSGVDTATSRRSENVGSQHDSDLPLWLQLQQLSEVVTKIVDELLDDLLGLVLDEYMTTQV